MTKPVNLDELRVRDQLAGKNILLSGTTGFLGKIVLSMLLHHFPEIKRVYALIRPGVSTRARDRFNKSVATSPAMRPLLEVHGERIAEFFDDKVVPVDGNIVKENCGISPEDLATLEREGLDIIINSAGLVDFDPPIDSALEINAGGIDNLVALSRRLDASLLHVSTCFVAGKRSGQILEDEEVLNAVPKGHEDRAPDFNHRAEVEQLKRLVAEVRAKADDPRQKAAWRVAAREQLESEGRDPDSEKALRSAIVRQRKRWVSEELRRVGMERAQFWGWTNTYTFTKSLGEQIIAEAAQDGLNTCILRPSIVESALEFPFPGWNEGLTTSAPLVLLSRAGLLHFPYAEELILDVIPVDQVAGTIIAVAAALLAGPHKLVYQVASGDTNPLAMKKAIEFTSFCAREYNAAKAKKGLAHWLKKSQEMTPLREEDFNSRSVPRYEKIARKVVDTVDSIGPDRFGWVRQPANAIRDVARNVEKSSKRAGNILELFMPFIARNKYVFRTENTRHVYSRLSEDERRKLYFDPTKYVWREYWRDVHVPGLEKWVFPQLEEQMAEKPKQVYTFRHLTELFESVTHKHRHKVALRYVRKSADETLTYGELRTLARRVAGFLVAQGVEPDDRVVLCAENRPEWVAAYFGILLAGATAVPVDQNATADELINIARASEAKGAMLSPRQGRRLVYEGATPDQITASGAALWLLNDVVCHKEEIDSPRDPARLASIIFTSGTTGKPKGVMLSQRNFTFEVGKLAGIFKLGPDDHVLSVLPLHHTFEFTAGLLLPLSRGARITYMSILDPKILTRSLKSGVTCLVGVPALWQLLQRRIEGQLDDRGLAAKAFIEGGKALNEFLREYAGINLGPLAAYPVHRGLGGRLKYLVSGGSALNPDVLDFFRGLGFNMTEGYGLTETSPVLTVTDPKSKLLRGSVGKPLPGVDLKIVEANDEGIGEVLARGPNIMQGYWGDTEATAAVMTEGWLKTGDLGKIDADGRLFLAGRAKDVIVDADGRNVYPDELEDVYSDHPRVEELSIVGLTHGDAERVAALVSPKYDDDKSGDFEHKEEVREEIRRHFKAVSSSLQFYRRVKMLHFFDGELPRTSTRKVKRAEVVRILERLTDADRKVSGAVHTVPNENALGFVQQILGALTGRGAAQITPQTRLGDLGFDSLMYVELGTALEEHAKKDISSEHLMGLEIVADILPLLGTTNGLVRARAAGSGAIIGEKKRSSVEESPTYNLPRPLVELGDRLLEWGQGKFYKSLMKVSVKGKGYIPVHTSFLVAANHTSHLDAGLVKTALGTFGRDLATLAARDYFFSSKFRRTYFENFTNLLPIERHGNLKRSLRAATGALERGRNLLIFPEGTRSPDGELMPFKPSLGYLALAAGVPVVPMYLWGTHEAMPKGSTLLPKSKRIGVVIGPQLLPEHFEQVTAGRAKNEAYRVATELVERAVRSLLDEGAYTVEALLSQLEADLADLDQKRALPEKSVEPSPKRSRAKESNGGKKSNGKTNGKPEKKDKPKRKHGSSEEIRV